jgi:hypothetical protein
MVKAAIKHPEIVEAASPVTLCASKDYGVVAEGTTDLAWAVLPRLRLQRLAVSHAPVCPRVVELLVAMQHLEKVAD